jgi:hypothetical protein
VTIGETMSEPEDEVIEAAFAKLDPLAMGVAVGVVSGLGIFIATAILLVRGGPVVGPMLSLLRHYVFGFEVAWSGAFVGLVEVGLWGFGLGYLSASLRNWGLKAYAQFMRWRGEANTRRNLLDKV